MFDYYSFGRPFTVRDDGVNLKDVNRTFGAKDFKKKKRKKKLAKKNK